MKSFLYLRLLAFLLPALVFTACEEDITDKVRINTKPELVVNAFISPQDTIFEVRVYKSRPVVGQVISAEESRVKNATVRISRGNQNVLLSYDPERLLYRARTEQLPVLPGQTYTLLVTTPDNYQVSASCTVPLTDGIAITQLGHEIRQVTWWDGSKQDQSYFTYKWQDAPGRKNYYHVFSEMEFTMPQTQNRYIHPMHGEDKSFLTDDKKDGLVFSGAVLFSNPSTPRQRLPIDLHFYLSVTDRPYHLFHQSLELHQNAHDNPFAEPVLVYSNVTGGLGIFAAYNQLKATLRVE